MSDRDTPTHQTQHLPAIVDLPDWLTAPTPPSTSEHSDQAPNTHLPSPQLEQPSESSEVTLMKKRELADLMYTSFFEVILDKMVEGVTLSDIVREDGRNYDIAKVRNWILKDPERKARYYEARRVSAEAVEDQLISIADAADNPLEDVQRSTLRINTRKWLLGVWDRKRYGDSRQLEVVNNNPLTENSLEMLADRLQKLRTPVQVYDVSSRTIED